MRKHDDRPARRRGGDKARREYTENAVRPVANIWNALRLRDATNRDEIKAQITLPKLKFMEKDPVE